MFERGRIGLVALVMVIACSSETSKSAQESWTEDYCGLVAPCCTKAGRGSDMSNCMTLLGGQGFDEAKADACLADRRAHQSDANFCDTAFLSIGACEGLFQTSGASGAKKLGETCAATSECASDARGTVECSDGASRRVCVLRIDGAKGDGPCVGTKYGYFTSYVSSDTSSITTGYICDKAKNLTCDDLASQTCTELVDVGGACTTTDHCVATAYCSPVQQTCTPRVGVGQSCEFGAKCVPGARCDEYGSRMCEALAEDGAPCVSGSRCASGACSNGTCASISSYLGTSLFCAN